MKNILFVFALLQFICMPVSVHASDSCFGIINQTTNPIRVFSKTGSMTYKQVAPHTIDAFCCKTAPSLCFDKSDGSTKAKFVSVDPNGLDEWSGTTCRKIRITPGQTVAVSTGADNKHIDCNFVNPKDFMPRFENIDADGDGQITSQEAQHLQMKQEAFKLLDANKDGYLNDKEYQNGLEKVNIFKGVQF